MEFSYKANQAGPLIGMSWKYPGDPSTHLAAVTAGHKTAKYKDLSDFYDQTADASKAPPNSDIGHETTV